MARILYDDGKKIGEIEEWSQREDPPTYKTFLGKTALLKPANNECTFVSPKPVHRKSRLTIIEDSKIRYVLEVIKVVGGTQIIAKIKEQAPVTAK
jgi:hypothetical protein